MNKDFMIWLYEQRDAVKKMVKRSRDEIESYALCIKINLLSEIISKAEEYESKSD